MQAMFDKEDGVALGNRDAVPPPVRPADGLSRDANGDIYAPPAPPAPPIPPDMAIEWRPPSQRPGNGDQVIMFVPKNSLGIGQRIFFGQFGGTLSNPCWHASHFWGGCSLTTMIVDPVAWAPWPK